MSSSISWIIGQGAKIAIKFTMPLTGDVTGRVGVLHGRKAMVRIDSDVAEGCAATAGTVRSSPAYDPGNAFDADFDTQWEPSFRNLTWIKVDLGEAKPIMSMVVRRAAGGVALRFDVHASNDDATWDLVHQQTTSMPTDYELHQIGFDATNTYRYWRITVTGRFGNYPGFSIIRYQEGVPIGNERAFTITAQEPRWTDIPSLEMGELIGSVIEPWSVDPHPTEPNTILLHMHPVYRFQNIEGNLTVNYDDALGSLAGLGGIVESFEQVFAPADLERLIYPHFYESLEAKISAISLLFNRIYHLVVGDGPHLTDDSRSVKNVAVGQLKGEWGQDNEDRISVSINNVALILTHVDIIDP